MVDWALMSDEEFRIPRLAAIYDALDPDRSDLDAYLGIAEELRARRVLDVGCGTGVLALRLAARGFDVVGVDPAAASLDVARRKPGADAVRWIEGGPTELSATGCDLALMTGNTAQLIVDRSAWHAALRGIAGALRPGGWLVFETRDPVARAWEDWNRAASYRTTEVAAVGEVASWVEITALNWPLVSFRWTWHFAADDSILTSESTLRFRERDEVRADLAANGYIAIDVGDAPDRPGHELVFRARRSQ